MRERAGNGKGGSPLEFCPRGLGRGDARTAMGHRRCCGPWGRPDRKGPLPPPWGLGLSAGPRRARASGQGGSIYVYNICVYMYIYVYIIYTGIYIYIYIYTFIYRHTTIYVTCLQHMNIVSAIKCNIMYAQIYIYIYITNTCV